MTRRRLRSDGPAAESEHTQGGLDRLDSVVQGVMKPEPELGLERSVEIMPSWFVSLGLETVAS